MPITASAGAAKFEGKKADLDDLIKRRFFFRQAFEIYGGVGGFFTYGPPGAAVKQNLIDLWRKHFVIEENLLEVDDTCIMPHDVLATSGHVERFNDFIVKDSKDPNRFWRADKLLEEVMDAKMADAKATEEQKTEYQKVKNQADAYSKDELWAVFQKYEIKAPETKSELTEPVEFNLMFPTPIGPVGGQHGYLRPETAQGIFLNFKFCLEQNAGAVPFGVAQIGKVFRNEIAPRNGLIRCREFSQAEIEYFVRPGDKKHAKFDQIADLEVPLHSSPLQLAAKPEEMFTLRAAVDGGIIANETLAFFMGRTYQFLVRAGCLPGHIRFRQHLPDEMAHYACDCWDAEIEMSMGWVECVGIADRSAYDLTCHGTFTNTSLTASAPLETPIKVEKYVVTKKALAAMGKEFKKDAKAVSEALTALDSDGLKALEAKAKAEGKATIAGFEISAEMLQCESKTEVQHVDVFTPNVIEPSFGIDRVLTAIYEHTFYVRAADGDEPAPAAEASDGKKKKEKAKDDKQKPGVLGFPPEVAPYKCVVLPLDMRIAQSPEYAAMMVGLRASLAEAGLQYKVDESGAAVGRRYARADELGVPFAITIDFDTLGIGAKESANPAGNATLRERDSTHQVRLPLSDLPTIVAKLCSSASLTWADLEAAHGADGAAAPAATPAVEGSAAMLSYLKEHGVTAKLNAAVNELAKARPADPMAFLAELLAKK